MRTRDFVGDWGTHYEIVQSNLSFDYVRVRKYTPSKCSSFGSVAFQERAFVYL